MVVLEPVRVGVQVHQQHGGFRISEDGTKHIVLSDPFTSHSTKKHYVDWCFKPQDTLTQIYDTCQISQLMSRTLSGGSSALVTARLGRVPQVKRFTIHLDALQDLNRQINESSDQFAISFAFVGFTDNKSIDLCTEQPIKHSAAIGSSDQHYFHSAKKMQNIIDLMSKGCSLPFVLSIKLETRNNESRMLGRLLLADLGSPSFENLPDRKPSALPQTISVMRDISNIIVTPGGAGEIPLEKSFFTTFASDLFGGSSSTVFFLHCDPTDACCLNTDVLPAIELFGLLRKIRNRVTPIAIDPRIAKLEAKLSQSSRDCKELAEQYQNAEQNSEFTISNIQEALFKNNWLYQSDRIGHEKRLEDMKAKATTLKLVQNIKLAELATQNAKMKEEKRREEVRLIATRHELDQTANVLVVEKSLNEQLDTAIRELAEERSKLRQQVSSLEGSLHSKVGTLQSLESKYQEHLKRQEARLAETNKNINELEDKRARLESETKEFATVKTKHESTIASLSNEVARLESKANKEHKTREQLEQQLDELHSQMKGLKSKREIEQNQLESLVEETRKHLEQERKLWESEKSLLVAKIDVSKEAETRWQDHLQKTLSVIESKSTEFAAGRQGELSELQSTLREARKEQKAYLEQIALKEKQQQSWIEERDRLLNTLASKVQSSSDTCSSASQGSTQSSKSRPSKPETKAANEATSNKRSARSIKHKVSDTSEASDNDRHDTEPESEVEKPRTTKRAKKAADPPTKKAAAANPARKTKSASSSQESMVSVKEEHVAKKKMRETTKSKSAEKSSSQSSKSSSGSLSGLLSFLKPATEGDKENATEPAPKTVESSAEVKLGPKLPKHVLDKRRMAMIMGGNSA